MKTSLTYGFAMTIASALLTLALYFTGYHSDPAKLGGSTGWITGIVMLAIGVTCIVLGTKARRAEVPATEEFSYGSALGTGVMIALFGGLFGILTNYLYIHVINPGYIDILMQVQIEKMEARGMSSTQVEQATGMMR